MSKNTIIAAASERYDISRTAWAIRLKIEEHGKNYIPNNFRYFCNLILNIHSNDATNVKMDANHCCQQTIAVSQRDLADFDKIAAAYSQYRRKQSGAISLLTSAN